MKILHVINNLGPGGAEKMLVDLVNNMNGKNGVIIEILLLSNSNSVFIDDLDQRVKVYSLKHNSIYNIMNIIEIVKFIREHNYEIIHSHLFPTQLFVGLSRMFVGDETRFITSEHSVSNRRRSKWYFRPIDRFIYRKYDTIISVSDAVHTSLMSWIKPKDCELNRFVVINNGIDLEHISSSLPIPRVDLLPHVDPSNILLCMVGRFVNEKDQSTIIRVIKSLPSFVHLVLVGEGILERDLYGIAKEEGVVDRVHFLGFRSDVLRIIKTVDVIIQSSRWEGLSLASVEGLASGKPVIASDVPGLREVVGGAGLLFELGNGVELEGIIRQLIFSKDYFDCVALKCVRRSREYDLNIMIDKLSATYGLVVVGSSR